MAAVQTIGGQAIKQNSVAVLRFTPNRGRANTVVQILGTGLDQVTGLSFNGRPASFALIDATRLTVVVPRGARSGRIKLITANGVVETNTNFRMMR